MGFFKKANYKRNESIEDKIDRVIKERADGLLNDLKFKYLMVEEIFKTLNKNIFTASYYDILGVIEIIKAIYVRLVLNKMSDSQIVLTIKLKLRDLFELEVSQNELYKILYNVKLPLVIASFDFNNSNHRRLIELSCNVDRMLNINEILISKLINESANELCFNYMNEFIMYVLNSSRKTNIVWSKSDEYIKIYNKAYDMAEAGLFSASSNLLIDSLKYNPIGIDSRFELINNFIELNYFSHAKTLLNDLSKYLLDEKNIALFYRRYGYLMIEENKLDVAFACYKISLNYEKSKNAISELEYIKNKANIDEFSIDIPNLLLNNKISILKSLSKEEVLNLVKEKGINLNIMDSSSKEDDNYIEKTVKKIVDALSKFSNPKVIQNEILPMLLVAADLVAISNNYDRYKISKDLSKKFLKLYDGDDIISFINDRKKKYANIINKKECRAEWLFGKFEYSSPISSLITTFGDFIYNPSCINDYEECPILIRGVDEVIGFGNQMNIITNIIVDFLDNIYEKYK